MPNFLKMEAGRNPDGQHGIYGSSNGFGGKDIRNGRNGSRFGLMNKLPTEEDEGWD